MTSAEGAEMSEMLADDAALAKQVGSYLGLYSIDTKDVAYIRGLLNVPQSSADSAHAKIANWLEDQARIATNGLHCGDNSTVIKHTYDWADKLEAAARHLRAEPRASADSAEPVAWAILGSNSASGIWKILQDKASADYWATQGFQVQPLGYLNRPASRAQPQSAGTESHSPAAMEGEKDTIVNLIHEHVGFEVLLAIESGVLTGVEKAAEAILAELGRRSQADSSPQATPELTATCQKLLPGGIVDDATYAEIEDALDRAEAPSTGGGRWLKLHERIAALTAERTAASAELSAETSRADENSRSLHETMARVVNIRELAEQIIEMRWLVEPHSQAESAPTIDDLPSCGQENDYRRAQPQAASSDLVSTCCEGLAPEWMCRCKVGEPQRCHCK